MGSHDQDLCAGKDIVIFGHWIPHVERMDEVYIDIIFIVRSL